MNAPGNDVATRTLSESASKALVGSFGVPILTEQVASDPRGARLAADAIGYPVVVKLCGDRIAHKTERALVRLGLSDATAVESAAQQLLDLATEADGDVEVLVAPMVRGTRELIVGVQRDAQFGPTVLIGIGGVLAEAVADVAIGLAPLTDLDAVDMIDALEHQVLLGPFRGEPAVDREVLAQILVGLSRLAINRPDIRSVDVNPLIIADGKPIAVDALVEVVA